MGSMLAGTEESPGKKFKYRGMFYKTYRGMGSIELCPQVLSIDISQKNFKDKTKYIPEGVEGRVKFAGNVSHILHQSRWIEISLMGYIGELKI